MEHDFWHERWENDQIAFHEGRPNVLLEHHFDALNLSSGDKIFLPLCGKTVDIHWLMAQGLEVVGADLPEIYSTTHTNGAVSPLRLSATPTASQR